jgi:ATP-dependent Clp protease ATP-binding subunit ClpC
MQTLAQTGRCAPATAGGRHASRTTQQHLAPFSGFRRAGVVDRTERSSAATLQAAVAKRTSSRGGKMVTKAMFERFTEKAIKVVMLAQEEARRLGHVSGGNRTSHVCCHSRPANPRLELTGRCVILAPSSRESKPSHRPAPPVLQNFVGTEQILLGLIGESTGAPGRLLRTVGACRAVDGRRWAAGAAR